MIIKKICVGELVTDFNKNFEFDIPISDSRFDYFPVTSTDYMTKSPFPDEFRALPAGYECKQSFDYYLDGQTLEEKANNPIEVKLDPNTGIFEILNWVGEQHYEITLVITTTDSVNHDVKTIEGITIDTRCGLTSTILIPPVLEPLYRIPNLSPLLSLTGEFESTNQLCPIVDYALVGGEDHFDLVQEGTSFTLTM